MHTYGLQDSTTISGLLHLLPIHHLDYMDKKCTFHILTCTEEPITRDVSKRFWSSIAHLDRAYIWSTRFNNNIWSSTLASHPSPWLYGQKMHFSHIDMYRRTNNSWCVEAILVINSSSRPCIHMVYKIQQQYLVFYTCFPSITLIIWTKNALFTYWHVPKNP